MCLHVRVCTVFINSRCGIAGVDTLPRSVGSMRSEGRWVGLVVSLVNEGW